MDGASLNESTEFEQHGYKNIDKFCDALRKVPRNCYVKFAGSTGKEIVIEHRYSVGRSVPSWQDHQEDSVYVGSVNDYHFECRFNTIKFYRFRLESYEMNGSSIDEKYELHKKLLKVLGEHYFEFIEMLASSEYEIVSENDEIKPLLGHVKIPKGSTYISESAFLNKDSLKSVMIPEGVTHIGGSAFHNTSLQRIALPKSVISIGAWAFAGCDFKEITIPYGVTEIKNNTFTSCSDLESVTIPDSVKSIGRSAFHYCKSLKSITIPGSVTSIGEYAFGECVSLKCITFMEGLTHIEDDAFKACTALTEITLPDSLTYLGDWAFDGCTALKSVTIPDSIVSIGKGAFRNCKVLKNITIPENVDYIGYMLLGGCDALKQDWAIKHKILCKYCKDEYTGKSMYMARCKKCGTYFPDM